MFCRKIIILKSIKKLFNPKRNRPTLILYTQHYSKFISNLKKCIYQSHKSKKMYISITQYQRIMFALQRHGENNALITPRSFAYQFLEQLCDGLTGVASLHEHALLRIFVYLRLTSLQESLPTLCLWLATLTCHIIIVLTSHLLSCFIMHAKRADQYVVTV